MNSYYSNRIEGQHTFPLDIERALHNDYAQDEDQARRQRLALAHMATEEQLEYRSTQWTNAQVWTPRCWPISTRISSPVCPRPIWRPAPLATMPSSRVDGARGRLAWAGMRRLQRAVAIFLDRWSSFYSGVRRGELQLVAMAAAHQRLAWIHPFRDGNGRVARLHSHLVLTHMGLSNGSWSPEGFARSQERYYALLAAADEPRRGDLDGRGNLTELGLIDWIAYVLELCMDQVSFMEGLLSLDGMKERMAACLAYEERVVRQGVRSEALRALHYLLRPRRRWIGPTSRPCWGWVTGWPPPRYRHCSSAACWRRIHRMEECAWACRCTPCVLLPRLWPEAEADSL